MSKTTDLIGLGVCPEQAIIEAKNIKDSADQASVATGLTAAGTVIGDALQLTALVNVISTAAASTGVKLPQGVDIGVEVVVQNNGASTMNLFPPTSAGTLNGGSAGAAVTIAAAAGNRAIRLTSTDWLVSVFAKES